MSRESDIAPLLHVSGLYKSYNVPVLTDFSFELRRGEVHALVGSNGAGKSTFARILCGLTSADAGEVTFDGNAHAPKSKREAEYAGVIMVLQELNVIGTLSVAENIFLNRLPQRGGWIRYQNLNEQAKEALTRVGLNDLDPQTKAGTLGVAQQQLIEIAGALSRDCRLLILDEPTAALTDPEIDQLFQNIQQLRADGVGIIYISHRMEEIRRIADRVTVLRDGRRVVTHASAAVPTQELIREMVGHDLPERKAETSDRVIGSVALRVDHLRAGERVKDVTFQVRCGEILGIAGLIGSGRTETLRAIFGVDQVDAGNVFVRGETKPATIRQPTDAVACGIGMIPEDRKQDGLLLPQPIRVNATLSTLRKHARHSSWIDLRSEQSAAESSCKHLSVVCASIEQAVGELSGGNQQKVLIARWLARDCDVLLFDEPTRGIDVAAKDTIYQVLRDLAGAGKGIVVVSSELIELMNLCDRIAVMSAGTITAEFTPGEWSQEKITQSAFKNYLSTGSGSTAGQIRGSASLSTS